MPRKFYLHAFWKWLLALFIIVMAPFLLLFTVALVAAVGSALTGNSAPFQAAFGVIMVLPLLFYQFLFVLYGIYYNPHVVLDAEGIRGQEIANGKFRFRRGRLKYAEMGEITEGRFFGIRYKCIHAIDEGRAILVFTSVRNAEECFNIISQKRLKAT